MKRAFSDTAAVVVTLVYLLLVIPFLLIFRPVAILRDVAGELDRGGFCAYAVYYAFILVFPALALVLLFVSSCSN